MLVLNQNRITKLFPLVQTNEQTNKQTQKREREEKKRRKKRRNTEKEKWPQKFIFSSRN